MTSKHKQLLREFKEVNTFYANKITNVSPLVGEEYAKLDGIAIKVAIEDGTWLRVYKTEKGELNWY